MDCVCCACSWSDVELRMVPWYCQGNRLWSIMYQSNVLNPTWTAMVQMRHQTGQPTGTPGQAGFFGGGGRGECTTGDNELHQNQAPAA